MSSLHTNAGAWLRAAIQLLPDVLLNPPQTGDATVCDQHLNSPVNTNLGSSSAMFPAEKNSSSNDAWCAGNSTSNARFFMCLAGGSNTDSHADPAATAVAESDLASPSGSARQASSGADSPPATSGGSSTLAAIIASSDAVRVAAHTDPSEGEQQSSEVQLPLKSGVLAPGSGVEAGSAGAPAASSSSEGVTATVAPAAAPSVAT